MEFDIDTAAVVQARKLVQGAVATVMKGTTPAKHPALRCEMAIREVAHLLYEQAEDFEMPARLTAALSDIGLGSEVPCVEYLRLVWEPPPESIHYVEGPEEAQ